MLNKKYYLLTLLGLVLSFNFQSASAQTEGDESNASLSVYRGAGYDVLDTALIPSRRMDQQRDFLTNQYDFPAKPRNQWEIGVSIGSFNVSGDVRSKNLFTAKNPGQTLGFGVHLRKAWGYIISTRLQYLHGTATGFNWQPSTGYWGHNDGNPWVLNYPGGPNGTNTTPVFYNYKTNVDELSFQLLASLNNIKFHKARNKASVYGIAGIGGMLYDTWVDALKGNKPYTADFIEIINRDYKYDSPSWTNEYRSRKAKNKDLKAMFDGTYESPAERHDNRP